MDSDCFSLKDLLGTVSSFCTFRQVCQNSRLNRVALTVTKYSWGKLDREARRVEEIVTWLCQSSSKHCHPALKTSRCVHCKSQYDARRGVWTCCCGCVSCVIYSIKEAQVRNLCEQRNWCKLRVLLNKNALFVQSHK